jgi:DnaJ-class molecular chaperone
MQLLEKTMRTYLIMLAGFLCLSGAALAYETVIPADKEVIQFETKLGTVTFLHKMHADLSVTKCTTCHHALKEEDERVKACHECHGKDVAEAPKVKTAFHSTCIGCHEYTVAHGDEAGPQKKKCKLCHVK